MATARTNLAANAAVNIAAGRLSAQQIVAPRFERPADLVAWMGAVQAQDYRACLWAVALRLRGGAASEAAIERAIAEGELLRLHAMRGTWQLMAPADVRWMTRLVGPRLIASMASRYAQLSLDGATIGKSLRALTRVLSGGAHLTRAELGSALARAGIEAVGPRLAHLLGHAELEGLICNGGRRGKHATFALLDERLQTAPAPLPREEALAELTRRYFRSRGPATADDFRWWSGLPASEARAGLEAAAPVLASQVRLGRTYYQAAGAPAAAAPRGIHLLPAFDEYLVGYRDRADVLDPKYGKRVNAGGGMLQPAVVQDGRVIGTWRRTLARDGVSVDLDLFARPGPTLRRALALAARRYAAFLGLAAHITIGGGR
jgi:Winged helix DNA-binding domain